MKRDSREIEDALRLGHEFQEFVAERFDPSAFTLIDYRTDGMVGGHFARANHNPDMVWRWKQAPSNAGYFAVECKYRGHWTTNARSARQRTWCEPGQLTNYRRFAKIKQMPVYVVLGMGGTARCPESIYTIPLRDLSTCLAEEKAIRRYKSASPFHSFTYADGIGPLRQDGPAKPTTAALISKPLTAARELTEPLPPSSPLPRNIIVPHPELRPVPHDRPRPPSVIVYVNTPQRRRTRPALILLLLTVVAVAVWQHFTIDRQPQVEPRPIVESAPVGPPPETSASALGSATQPASAKRDPQAPNYGPSQPRAVVADATIVADEPDTLYHYQKPLRAFRLTVEASEPATEGQLTRAVAIAQMAVARISKKDRPPYLAVETLPSDRYPKLRALMLYDVASDHFVGPTAFMSIADIDPGTKLYIGSHEALWVANGSW